MERYPLILKPDFGVRNKIINENNGKDIDNFTPKDQIKVLQSYLSVDLIKEQLSRRETSIKNHARQVFKNFKYNVENPYKQLGWMGGNPFISYAGFNKTGLKAYYKFDSFYLPTVTLDSNFSQYADQTAFDAAWVPADTAKIRGNPSTDVIDFIGTRDSSNDTIYYDLGAGNVSDTSWTLRFKMTLSAISGDPLLSFGIADITTSPSNTGDFAGVLFRPGDGSTNRIQLVSTNGEVLQNAYEGGTAGSDGNSSYSLTTSVGYRVSYERISATLHRFVIYTDDFLTPVATVSGTISSSTIGGRYIRIHNYTGDSTGGNFQGTVEYFKFYNSVSPVLHNHATDVGSGDSLGTAADGSLNGAISIVAGKINNAYSFNGSTAYCDIGTSLSQLNFLHNTTALWTINFWLKKAAGTPAAIYSILGVHKDNNASGTGLDLNISTNRRVVCYISNGSASVIDNTGAGLLTSNDTNWHMITCRYDQSLGSANFKAREDNGSDTSNDKSGNSPSDSNVSQVPRIGNNQATYYLNGSLDEMSIWNRVITDSEITTLYNSGNGQVIT